MNALVNARVRELQQLIQANLDSRHGLRQAAATVLDTGLQSLFERWALDRKTLAEELSRHLDPADLATDVPNSRDAIPTTAVRSAWHSVSDSMIPQDRHMVLGNIERAEELLETTYNAVLRAGTSGLDPLLIRHRATIRSTIDQIRGLRIALETQLQR